MKSRILAAVVPSLLFVWPCGEAMALEGDVFIHDPSTVIQCEGKYYTYGTGGGGLISDDGWTWRRGAVRPGGGVGSRRDPYRRSLLCQLCHGRRGSSWRARRQNSRDVVEDARPSVP